VVPGSETTWGCLETASGPGFFNIDTGIYKNIPTREGVRLSIGLQFYNLLNHPNFANPSGNIASPGFGLITNTVGQPSSLYGEFQGSAVNGRLATLGGRLTF
jgi:hypothetical protein